MSKFSLTLKGLAILAVVRVYEWAGLSFNEAAWQSFLQVAGELILIVTIYYGRFRKGDITWHGKRK